MFFNMLWMGNITAHLQGRSVYRDTCFVKIILPVFPIPICNLNLTAVSAYVYDSKLQKCYLDSPPFSSFLLPQKRIDHLMV